MTQMKPAQPPNTPILSIKWFPRGSLNRRRSLCIFDDLQASTGSMIFGGIDTEKFTLPLNQDDCNISQFYVSLTEITITTPHGPTTGVGPSTSYPLNVLLDSGTSLTLLPTDIINSIAAKMGAKADSAGNYLLPDCDLSSTPGSIGFIFSGLKIEVPYSQMAVKVGTTCYLGLATTGNRAGCGILGETFLRSAYVVYDLVVPYPAHRNSNCRTITRSRWHRHYSTPQNVISSK
jgi:hypothetical protein